MFCIYLLLGQMSNTFSGSLAFILQMTGHEKIFRNILSLSLIHKFHVEFSFNTKNGIILGCFLACKF